MDQLEYIHQRFILIFQLIFEVQFNEIQFSYVLILYLASNNLLVFY